MFAHAMADEIVALRAERDRYAAALDAILALQPDWIGGPRATLDRAQDEARKARKGTGQ